MSHPISSATRLAELVEYQHASVVSRVVLRSPGGTMTVFAFAGGQGLSEHTNPNDAVVQVLDGEVRIQVGGTEHLVRQGEWLHLPPSVPHALLGGAPFKMLLTLLKQTPGVE
ncbi:MAG: cupin domain-containing protein [Gemmatimonadota bacterium]|nr:cupin domain-containing protein [Gemmatimonadota bacterium]